MRIDRGAVQAKTHPWQREDLPGFPGMHDFEDGNGGREIARIAGIEGIICGLDVSGQGVAVVIWAGRDTKSTQSLKS